MDITLTEHERRVVGVLMEKAMTQPEYYPMTINAIVAACNQRNNRDPIMELDEVAVGATLETLRRRGLVEQILPAPGARTDRFKHKIEARFGWGPRERAVVAELLLRGPQTPGELRTRCSRFVPFEDLEAVHTVLEALQACDPPVVASLPREPGQSAIRFTHLFFPESERPATTGPIHTSCRQDAASSPSAVPRPHCTTDTPATVQSRIETEEIHRLQAQVAALGEQISRLTQRVEQLEATRTP